MIVSLSHKELIALVYDYIHIEHYQCGENGCGGFADVLHEGLSDISEHSLRLSFSKARIPDPFPVEISDVSDLDEPAACKASILNVLGHRLSISCPRIKLKE